MSTNFDEALLVWGALMVFVIVGWCIIWLILVLNDRAYRAKQRRLMMTWHGLYGHPETSRKRHNRRRGAVPRR